MAISRRSIVKRMTGGAVASLAAGAIANLPRHHEGDDRRCRVCTSAVARIQAEPDRSSPVRASVARGDRVRVLGPSLTTDGDVWIPVMVEGPGATGWTGAEHYRHPGHEGMRGWLPGAAVHVSSDPGDLFADLGVAATPIRKLRIGANGLIVDGPRSADGSEWYRVVFDGALGWMPAGSLADGAWSALGQDAGVGTPVPAGRPASVGITIAAVDSPPWMRSGAAYVCDGEDDHLEWQAAIDEAQTYETATTAIPAVLILPGTYSWSGSVTKRGCDLIGMAAANTGVRVVWNGPDSGTALYLAATQMSFAQVSNIHFEPGTGDPECWIDATADSIDALFMMRGIHFVHGWEALRIGSWFNCHLERLRWDGFWNYGIVFTPYSGQNVSSFRLSGFTVDNADSAPAGFVHIDNTDGGEGSLGVGTMAFRDARMEQQSPYQKGLFVFTGKQANATQLHVQDVTNDSGRMSTVLFYREDASDPIEGSESILVENVRVQGPILGGDWHVDESMPAPTAQGIVSHFAMYGDSIIQNQETRQYSRNTSDVAYESFVAREPFPRFQQLADGQLQWGGGASEVDTSLHRASAGRLRTESELLVDGGITVDRHLHHTGPTAGFFGADPAERPVVNPTSTGAALRELEAEVNALKEALRAIGLVELREGA
jgi:hypothetical protein